MKMMKMWLWTGWTCWIILGFPFLLVSRENVRFQRISIRDGLSQSSVFCMMQDRKGFLWFGTQDGLNRYDGMEFTVFKPDPDDPTTLSLNQIPSMCEDRQGFIWLALTGGGINRLDPRTEKFYRFPSNPSADDTFGGFFYNAIICDRENDIWAGSNGLGLEWMQRRNGVVRVVRFNRGNGFGSNAVLSLAEDGDGYIWAGTANDGLKRFDRRNNEIVHYRNDPANPRSLGSNTVNCLLADRQGGLWAGATNGLFYLEKKTGTFRAYRNDPRVPGSISDNNIFTIYEDRGGKLWVGTANNGLNLFDKRTETFTVFRHDAGDANSLSSDLVSSIMEDESKVLWVGTTAAGLNKFTRGSHFSLYRSHSGQTNSLSFSNVYSVLEDSQGIMWVGNIGYGLDRVDRTTGEVDSFRNNPADPSSLSDNVVRCVYEDRKGRIWIGTQVGGLNRIDYPARKFKRYLPDRNNPRSIASFTVRWMLEDQAGRFWLATLGGLELFDPEKGEFSHRRSAPNDFSTPNNNALSHISESPAEPGILWISTLNGGLNRFDISSGQFQYYAAIPNDPNTLSSNIALCTYIDPAEKGVVWVCTYGGGLNKMIFSPGGGVRVVHYTEKNGLPNNCVYAILPDDAGNLWMSTNKGICCFNPKEETVRNFSELDGLQGDEFNAGAYFRSRSGELFFGGITGLNAFYPNQFQPNRYMPPVAITDFQIFNKRPPIGPESVLKETPAYVREIHLNYRQNMFSFAFAALDYTIPGRNRYAHRLENLEQDWNYTDARRRFAVYANVPPGRYVFRVRASNNDELWNNDGASFVVVVEPPFWKTLWFYLLAAALVLSAVFLVYRRRVHNVRLKTEMRTAHDAQMSIMPREDPVVTGLEVSGACVPASEVGGDFFDYLWLNGDRSRFAVVVGDISGKAMRSAMTAVMTSGMISMEALADNSIADILRRVNRPLYIKTNRNVFAALCIASINTESRELAFSNAGLSDPLLRTSDGVSTLRAAGRKLPLGVRPDIEYMEQRYCLNPGDVVLFYTDGITEAKNMDGDFYGLERLKTVLGQSRAAGLTAREIKDLIVGDVRIFSGGADQYDDMTLVAVKVL